MKVKYGRKNTMPPEENKTKEERMDEKRVVCKEIVRSRERARERAEREIRRR